MVSTIAYNSCTKVVVLPEEKKIKKRKKNRNVQVEQIVKIVNRKDLEENEFKDIEENIVFKLLVLYWFEFVSKLILQRRH